MRIQKLAANWWVVCINAGTCFYASSMLKALKMALKEVFNQKPCWNCGRVICVCDEDTMQILDR